MLWQLACAAQKLLCHWLALAGAWARSVPNGNGNIQIKTARPSINTGQICLGTASNDEIEKYATALTYLHAEVGFPKADPEAV